jgi:hypothetical protein
VFCCACALQFFFSLCNQAITHFERWSLSVMAMLRHVANRPMALPLAADGTLGLGTKKM